MKKTRLTRDRWIEAGLDALCDHGPAALAAEPLARALNTTKGSFYWHFKDVPAFQTAVCDAWQARAFAHVVAALQAQGGAADRLRGFGHVLLNDPAEAALRGWAHADPEVAKAVALVDTERLTHVSNLLGQLGLKNPDFARACLAALVGMPHIPGTTGDAARAAYDTLIDTVLALQDA